MREYEQAVRDGTLGQQGEESDEEDLYFMAKEGDEKIVVTYVVLYSSLRRMLLVLALTGRLREVWE